MFIKLLVSAIIPALIFQSCHFGDLDFDKIQTAPINPKLGFKVGEATYTIRELIEDLESESFSIEEGDDLSLKIVIEESLDYSNNDDIIKIETIRNTSQYNIPMDVPALPVEQTVPFSTTFNFQFSSREGEKIDSVYFNDGILEYDMNSTFPATVDYGWTIVNTKDVMTNTDLSQSNKLIYSGTQIIDSYSRPLDGLKILMYQIDDKNQFNVDLVGNFIVPAGQELTTDQGLEFNLAYVDPKIKLIYGNFGKQQLEVEGVTIDMSSLGDFLSKGVFFTDPSITLNITNSYGIEMLLSFDQITANYSDGSVAVMQESMSLSEKLVGAPEMAGESVTSQIKLNNTNSNFADLINGIPNQMQFNIGVEANPDNSSLVINFLEQSSSIHVDARIEVPFQFKMDGFETDFDFEVPDLKSQEINSLNIQMSIINDIPINGDIFLDFVDDNGLVFSGLDQTFEINSPEIGTDGRTIASETAISSITLSAEDIQNLINASKINLRLKISTFESDQNKDIILYADYALKIELALIGDVSIAL